jgi:hypothetical protein
MSGDSNILSVLRAHRAADRAAGLTWRRCGGLVDPFRVIRQIVQEIRDGLQRWYSSNDRTETVDWGYVLAEWSSFRERPRWLQQGRGNRSDMSRRAKALMYNHPVPCRHVLTDARPGPGSKKSLPTDSAAKFQGLTAN